MGGFLQESWLFPSSSSYCTQVKNKQTKNQEFEVQKNSLTDHSEKHTSKWTELVQSCGLTVCTAQDSLCVCLAYSSVCVCHRLLRNSWPLSSSQSVSPSDPCSHSFTFGTYNIKCFQVMLPLSPVLQTVLIS